MTDEGLGASLTLSRAIGLPYAEAKALYAYGMLHLAHGEPERAQERLTESLAILGQLGEGVYRPHIAKALAKLATAHPRSPAPSLAQTREAGEARESEPR